MMLQVSYTHAATPAPPGLFSTLPGKAQAALPEQAIDGRSRSVKINYGQLRSGRFFVSLPGDISFEAVRDQQRDLGKNRFAWIGHASGNPASRVVIGVSGDAAAGAFAYQGKLFKLEPRANGTHVLSEVEPGDPAPELDPIPVADTSSTTMNEPSSSTSADTGTTIDVMVAYTPAIESIYGVQGTDALIIQAVEETNQAYTNSGIQPRLNLVHTVLTNYVESGDMGLDLSRLRSTNDGYMDELHALRDSHGADLVSLIEDEPQYCGIAYRMTSLSASFASSAFSVVHRTCATGYYSFAHELGHNQGAHHDQANASGAIYSYAYGHQDPFNAFRTVMAYNCSGGCTRVDYFSNPDVFFSGDPTGSAGYADNARAIDDTAATVAGFRQQTSQTPPTVPTGLTAAPVSHSTIDLAWADSSQDESGFYLERSDNGVDFSQIATLSANSTFYQDDNLLAATFYSYRARAWNSAGNSGYSNVAVAATDPAPPVTDQTAGADMPVAGNVSGTYQNTWDDDGIAQTLQEQQSGGKKNRRYGYLEHKWTFQVQPGNSVVLLADVQATTTADHFTFAYSTDNSDYIDMFAVDAGSSGAQQFVLPATLNGTVYVRVKDAVRQAGNTSNHSVRVDHLLIRSENDSNATPPSAPENLLASAAAATEIDLQWSDTSGDENGFIVERRLDGSSQWDAVKTTGPDATSHTDTGLQAATRYHYRVNAFNGGGTSAYSNSDSAQTDDQVIAEITLSASGYKQRGLQKVQLSWSGTNGSSVDIYRDNALLQGSATDTGSFTDNINSKGGGSYQYQVCEVGTSNCSNEAIAVF